jgi:hypothetical protein
MQLTPLLLTVTLLLSSMSFSPNNNAPGSDPTKDGSTQARPEAQSGHEKPFRDVVNGERNPAAIADSVAYDLFFRSLIFAPEERAVAESRLQALAAELELSEAETNLLREFAEKYNERVVALDRRAETIKDKHLSNLDAQDVEQLSALQKQKEAIVTSTVASLPSRFAQATASKLRSYIDGRVKRRVRSVQPPRMFPINSTER